MLNVKHERMKLERMTPRELRARYAEVFGEPSRSGNKPHLIKRILWRMQAEAEGSFEERMQRLRERALELSRDADIRLSQPKDTIEADRTVVGRISPTTGDELAPGTVLVRDYKSRRIEVKVLDDGYEFEQKRYSSLSAVARAVTGTKWNGRLFFGLAARRRKDSP